MLAVLVCMLIMIILISVTQVKTTTLGVEKIGPSEMYVSKFHDSNLLIPGRHIQLKHTIGEGT